MAIHPTYTMAIMHVSKETYEEIKKKMIEAGYDHVFHSHENGPVIDMNGIAIQHRIEDQPLNQLTAGDLSLSGEARKSPWKQRSYKK